jgi:hypothetical protein
VIVVIGILIEGLIFRLYKRTPGIEDRGNGLFKSKFKPKTLTQFLAVFSFLSFFLFPFECLGEANIASTG